MAEYRIDDLAREAGTTVRNVRVYQDRGLLPPPRREGRTGWYSDSHLARLKLIGRLLERGYTFAIIGELLHAWQAGQQIEDLLGLEDAVTQPWTDERPGEVTLPELRAMFGSEATRAAIKRACDIGVLQRAATGFSVPSPTLLAAGRDLVAGGIPLQEVLDLAEALQADMAVTAARFVDMVAGHVLPPDRAHPPSSEEIVDITVLLAQLRTHAQRAVGAVFSQAMQGELASVFGREAAKLRPPTGDSQVG